MGGVCACTRGGGKALCELVLTSLCVKNHVYDAVAPSPPRPPSFFLSLIFFSRLCVCAPHGMPGSLSMVRSCLCVCAYVADKGPPPYRATVLPSSGSFPVSLLVFLCTFVPSVACRLTQQRRGRLRGEWGGEIFTRERLSEQGKRSRGRKQRRQQSACERHALGETKRTPPRVGLTFACGTALPSRRSVPFPLADQSASLPPPFLQFV